MPHKQEITLVMKGHHLATTEFGGVREEGPEEAANAMTQASVEIVEDEFGDVGGGLAMVLNLGARHHVGNLEESCGSVGEMGDEEAVADLGFLTEDEDVCEPACLGMLANGLDLEAFPGIEEGVGNQLHEVTDKMKELSGRARAGGDEDFGCLVAGEVGLEFIFCFVCQDLFVLGLHHRLVHFPGVVQGAGHLNERMRGGEGCVTLGCMAGAVAIFSFEFISLSPDDKSKQAPASSCEDAKTSKHTHNKTLPGNKQSRRSHTSHETLPFYFQPLAPASPQLRGGCQKGVGYPWRRKATTGTNPHKPCPPFLPYTHVCHPLPFCQHLPAWVGPPLPAPAPPFAAWCVPSSCPSSSRP